MGKKFGKYTLEEQIGRGGSKDVWKAYDTIQDRWVALKLIKKKEIPRLKREGVSQEDLFFREAKILTQLNHPNIVKIHDADEKEGYYYIAEEFIDGPTLEEKIQEGLNQKQILEKAIQIVRGIEYIHNIKTDQGILLHGDLKSDNIMLKKDQIKITDFGLSSWTDENIPSGSILTKSPEQEYSKANYLSEIYSVGTILYEMCTKKNPIIDHNFQLENQGLNSQEYRKKFHIIQKRGFDSSIRKHNQKISSKLEKIISKSLDLNPNKRFANVKKLRKALEWEQKKKKVYTAIGFACILTLGAYSTFKPIPPKPLDDRILLTSTVDGDSEIYSYSLEREELMKLTDNEVKDSNIVSHPHGERFLFETKGEHFRDIQELDVNGKEKLNVANNRGDEFGASYYDDGNAVIYLETPFGNEKPTKIYIAKRIGGEWKENFEIYSGEEVSKVRCFEDNTAIFLENGDLKFKQTNPGDQVYVFKEDVSDFEIEDMNLYYVQNGTLFRRRFQKDEIDVQYVNYTREMYEEKIIELGKVPNGSKLSPLLEGKIIQIISEDKIFTFNSGDRQITENPESKEVSIKDINKKGMLIKNNDPQNLEKVVVYHIDMETEKGTVIPITHIEEVLFCNLNNKNNIDDDTKLEKIVQKIPEKTAQNYENFKGYILGNDELYENGIMYKSNNGELYIGNEEHFERITNSRTKEIWLDVSNGVGLYISVDKENNNSIGIYIYEDGNSTLIDEPNYFSSSRINSQKSVFYKDEVTHKGIFIGDARKEIDLSKVTRRDSIELNPRFNKIAYHKYGQEIVHGVNSGVSRVEIYDFDNDTSTNYKLNGLVNLKWGYDGATLYVVDDFCFQIHIIENGNIVTKNIHREMREIEKHDKKLTQILATEEGISIVYEEGTQVMGQDPFEEKSIWEYNKEEDQLRFIGNVPKDKVVIGIR
jgi:serine/threonine protein kinase